MLELNKIYQGDCLELMPLIDDKSIDMILCDLPYGITACKWDNVIPFEPLWNNYKRIIKDNGAIVLTASQPFTTDLINSNRSWFKYELIWDRNFSGAPGIAKYRPMPSHESIIIFGDKKINYNPQMGKGKPYIDKGHLGRKSFNDNEHKVGYKNRNAIINNGERFPLSVIKIQKYNQQGQHPTQKPVALFEYLIKTYTNENELVLDNCIGGGTTAIACMQTNRNFIGIELEPKYVEIANKRLANTYRQLELIK